MRRTWTRERCVRPEGGGSADGLPHRVLWRSPRSPVNSARPVLTLFLCFDHVPSSEHASSDMQLLCRSPSKTIVFPLTYSLSQPSVERKFVLHVHAQRRTIANTHLISNVSSTTQQMGANIMGAVLSVLYAARNGLMDCEVMYMSYRSALIADAMLAVSFAHPRRRCLERLAVVFGTT